MPAPYAPVEVEVIILRAVWDLLDSLVNREVLQFDGTPASTTVRPQRPSSKALFAARLNDFLSYPNALGLPTPPATLPQEARTYLFHLRAVAGAPQLNTSGGALIAAATEALADWLGVTFVAPKTWFPSIERELDFRLTRVGFLKICGNISKHNFSRLGVDVSRIRRLFADNGVDLTEEQGFLVIPDFYGRYFDDIFAYHLTTIAAMLNDLRGALYDYLRPPFEAAFVQEPGDVLYRFNQPSGCAQTLPQTFFHDLMNDVRSPPYVPRFAPDPGLRLRY